MRSFAPCRRCPQNTLRGGFVQTKGICAGMALISEQKQEQSRLDCHERLHYLGIDKRLDHYSVGSV